MATKLEIQSAHMTLTNVADISHLTNEESLRTSLSPLSDSSNKASDLSSSPISPILVEKRTFGKNFTSLMSVSEIKPRLSPKPFCKEEISEFAGGKKPIVTPKLYPLLKSWQREKPAEQKQTNDELQGSGGTFGKDTNLEDDGKSIYGLSATKNAYYSKAEPNKYSAGISRSKSLRLTQGLKDELKPTGPLQTKPWQSHHTFEEVSKHLLSFKNEDALQKDFPSSLNARQCRSEGPVISEKVEFSSDEKCKGFSNNVATEIEPSSLVKAIHLQRPVSEDQKLDKVQHRGAETCESSSAKVFIHKSKHLFMDKSSKFESTSVVQLSNESTENVRFGHASKTCSLDNENEIIQSSKQERTLVDQREDVPLIVNTQSTECLKKEENLNPGGTIKNRISQLLSVSGTSPAVPEVQTSEKEKGNISIQQRIKDLTTENADLKPGSTRRSFQSRPLSADLTKLFINLGPATEIKSEKSLEKNNEHSEEAQPEKVHKDVENQKSKEDQKIGQTNSGDSSAEGIQWVRPQSPATTDKEGQLMKKQNGSENRRSLSFQSKPSVSSPNLNEQIKMQTVSSESEGLKTVKATLFDHKVEWHNASDERAKKDSVFMTDRTAVRKSDAFDLSKHEKEIKVKNELEAKTHSKEGDYRQFVASEENPHYEQDTNNCQRVEPRYEIFQTVGERALSELILMPQEDKAVTLRSRKPSLYNKHTFKTDVKTVAPDLPLMLSDNKTYQFNASAKNVAQSMVEKPMVTEKTDTNFEQKYKLVQLLSDARESEKAYLTEGYNVHRSARKEEIKASENKQISKVNETGQVASNTNNPERFRALECLFSNNVDVQVETVETLNLRDMSENQSPKISSRESWISGYESSNTIDFFTDDHARTQLIAVDNGESRVFGLKQYQQIGGDNKDVNVNTNDTAEDQSKATKMGVKNRKRDGTVSNLKMSERWRRRSAPQDTIAVFTPLSPTSRGADTLLAAELETVKWKERREFVAGNVLSQSEPGSQSDCRDSTVVQKARYFAVTGKVADLKKESDYEILKSEFSKIDIDHDTSVNTFSEVYSTKYSSNTHSNTNLPLHYNNVSSETYLIRKSATEENEEGLGLSKHGLSNINTNLVDDVRRKRNRNKSTGRMKENTIDVDSLLETRKEKFSISVVENMTKHHEPDTCPMQKDVEKVVQKNLDERRHYRLGVLDIDALMAEYASDNSKVKYNKERLSNLSKERKTFEREKSKSLRVKNETPSHKWKDELESTVPGPTLKYLSEENRYALVDFHSLEKTTTAGSSEEGSCAKLKERATLFDMSDHLQQVHPFTDKYVGLRNECSNKEITVLSNVKPETSINDVKGHSASSVQKPTNPTDVDIKTHSNEDFKASTNIRLRKALSIKQKDTEKPQDHKPKQVEQAPLAKANNGDSLMAIKADLQKFKDNLTEYSSDLKLLATEKYLDKPPKQREKGKSNLSRREQAPRLLDVKHYGIGNVTKLTNPVDVDCKTSSNEECSTSRVTTDLHVQRASSRQCMIVEKPNVQKTKHVDPASLVNANNGNTLMALKSDLIKFKSTLTEYSADLKPSFSGDERQAIKRESIEKKLKERSNEQRKDRYSLQQQYTESSTEKRLSRDSSYHMKDQLKQCFGRPVSKDTETLVREADSHYGTWSAEHQSQDSIAPRSPSTDDAISTRKQPPNRRVSSSSSQLELDHHDATKDQRTGSLDRSSVDVDSIDGTVLPPSVRSCPEEGEIDFSFMDQPSVLDSSALKNRVQLSRKSHRRAPTLQAQRRSKARLSESQFAVIDETDSAWMFKDTTDEKFEKEEESEEEEEKTPKSVGQQQRLPVFPGLDPSVLKVQLRKRQETDSPTELSGAGHVYKSPKSSLQQGAIGGRPLPSAAEKDDRTIEMSPQWLQELKSKKRLSLYENSS